MYEFDTTLKITFVSQVMDILGKGTVKPAVNQVECHAFFNQRKLKSFLDEHSITLVAYSPLGNPHRPWAKPKADFLSSLNKISMITSLLWQLFTVCTAKIYIWITSLLQQKWRSLVLNTINCFLIKRGLTIFKTLLTWNQR